MSFKPDHPWICAQIGSREHYTIPRVLHEQRRLRLFLTDFWAENSRFWPSLPTAHRKRIKERFSSDLAGAPVVSLGNGRLVFDLQQRLMRRVAWDATVRRNEWFQEEMLRLLRGPHRHLLKQGKPGTFFSYSYAAGKLFEFFRSEGWRTILGQIDPGPRQEVVTRELEGEKEFPTLWERAPEIYWERWREECSLADLIWVNSSWSHEALLREGIADDRIRVMPLVYSDLKDKSISKPKSYPRTFTRDRPLRILFLGQINLQKGIHLLLRAARNLAEAPVEFWMVGPSSVRVPEEFSKDPRFRWTGPVSRKETTDFYSNADVFVFPTLSDGFGMTQLEAQARRLPVLASRFCGGVVRDGENGLLIDPLDEETLTEKLRYCLDHPQELAGFSRESRVAPEFRPSALADFLNDLSGSPGFVAEETPSY